MAKPSPLCEVKVNAGSYTATDDGINVAGGDTVIIRLISQSGVESWDIRCISTDELSDRDAVNVASVVDIIAKTCTLTIPTGVGRTLRWQSQINGGVGNNVKVPSYTTTFGIYTPSAGGLRTVAADETIESDPVFGYIASINRIIRDPASVTGTDTPPADPSRSLQMNNGGVFGSFGWLNPAATSNVTSPFGSVQYTKAVDGTTDMAVWAGFENDAVLGYGPNGLYIGTDTDDIGPDYIEIDAKRAIVSSLPGHGATNVFTEYTMIGMAAGNGDDTAIEVAGHVFTPNVALHSLHASDALNADYFGGGLGVFRWESARTVPTVAQAGVTFIWNDPTTHHLKAMIPDGTIFDLMGAGTPAGPDRSLQIDNAGVFGSFGWTNPGGTHDVIAPSDAIFRIAAVAANRAVFGYQNLPSDTSAGPIALNFGGDSDTTDWDQSNMFGNWAAGMFAGVDEEACIQALGPLVKNPGAVAAGISGVVVRPNQSIGSPTWTANTFGGGDGVVRFQTAVTPPSSPEDGAILMWVDAGTKCLKYMKPDGSVVDTCTGGGGGDGSTAWTKQTTNNSAQTAISLDYSGFADGLYEARCKLRCYCAPVDSGYFAEMVCTFTITSGALTKHTTHVILSRSEGSGTLDTVTHDFADTSNHIIVLVTGLTSRTINWSGELSIKSVLAAGTV